MTDETWLWRNPKALASVLRGLAQAARGEFAEPPNEKGDAMDDATAERLAKHLVDEGWLKDECQSLALPPGGPSPLAKVLQEAAKPPEPERKPGLYFIRGYGAAVQLQRRYADGDWARPEAMRCFRDQPDGEIISGPHTCEELLEAAQRPQCKFVPTLG